MGFFCCLRFKEKRPDANRIGGFVPLSLLIQARMARRTPAINGQASTKQRNLMRKHGVFLLSAVQEKRPDVARIGRCALLSLVILLIRTVPSHP
ncbi:hypothetical protein BZP36_14645 [Raoultella terrigena]|nr:hypothetical protein BZP36_14645 [Raoultella terrigena]